MKTNIHCTQTRPDNYK